MTRLQVEVGHDLFNDRGLVNEGDDSHGIATLRAEQRVGFVSLFDEVGPPALEGLRDCGMWDPDHWIRLHGIPTRSAKRQDLESSSR